MLQGEHSAILLTFIKLPFVIKTFVFSIFKWPFYTGSTVYINSTPQAFFWAGISVVYRYKVLSESWLLTFDVSNQTVLY